MVRVAWNWLPAWAWNPGWRMMLEPARNWICAPGLAVNVATVRVSVTSLSANSSELKLWFVGASEFEGVDSWLMTVSLETLRAVQQSLAKLSPSSGVPMGVCGSSGEGILGLDQ